MPTTAANGPASTVDSHPSKPFRFFSLPRELRDIIIAYLKIVCVAPSGAITIACRGRSSPAYRPLKSRTLPPALRLVNRQFKQEVDSVIRGISHTVEFEEHRTTRGPVPDCGNIVLHPELPHAAEARIVYHVDDPWILPATLQLMWIWASRFIRANPRVERVHVAMAVLWFDEEKDIVWPERPAGASLVHMFLDGLVGIEEVSTVEVQKWSSQQEAIGLWVSWDRKGGWRAPRIEGADGETSAEAGRV